MDGDPIRFAVVGGSAVEVDDAAGKSIREICAMQNTSTQGLQPVVNGQRVTLDHVLQGGESLMLVQKITGN